MRPGSGHDWQTGDLSESPIDAQTSLFCHGDHQVRSLRRTADPQYRVAPCEQPFGNGVEDFV